MVNNSQGYYGPVCDRHWDINDGNIVCRQLGFGGAARISVGSEFGKVDNHFAMDEVRCNGNESSIQECEYSLEDNWMCKGAGVVCQRKYYEYQNLIHLTYPYKLL